MNIFDSIAGRVADPEATAIETPGGARITHAGLIARSGRMANALASLGVAPGDRQALRPRVGRRWCGVEPGRWRPGRLR